VDAGAGLNPDDGITGHLGFVGRMIMAVTVRRMLRIVVVERSHGGTDRQLADMPDHDEERQGEHEIS
jgi:hypothetical protein